MRVGWLRQGWMRVQRSMGVSQLGLVLESPRKTWRKEGSVSERLGLQSRKDEDGRSFGATTGSNEFLACESAHLGNIGRTQPAKC